ncbi:MAG: class I SAM-dependent methyltransferase [Candidatus Sericytochromatia bacterium]|nr:class I SAM-dependent methyltransferase [Candidatus Sericytochromatia bacterium]
MSLRTLNLSDALHAYLTGAVSREPECLARLRAETALLPEARMQISPEQGQFLHLLVKLLGVRRALEVGVFTGYSSLVTALALPPDGRLLACDISDTYTQVARRHWEAAGVAERVELRLGPALDTLDALIAAGQADTFDLAFIDADKANYEAYYERALRLVRPGGLVAIDNTLWSGRVADPSCQDPETCAIRSLNARMQADARIDFCLLPIGDGLSLAVKRPDGQGGQDVG